MCCSSFSSKRCWFAWSAARWGYVVADDRVYSAAVSPGWEIGFSPLALLTAFLCSTLTGVLFGWLPARNAARLDPVDALARE
jgi:ABC-type antimicrobial peptide transport system permease subunit